LVPQIGLYLTTNFGTTEEKSFVAHFASYVEQLKREYEKSLPGVETRGSSSFILSMVANDSNLII